MEFADALFDVLFAEAVDTGGMTEPEIDGRPEIGCCWPVIDGWPGGGPVSGGGPVNGGGPVSVAPVSKGGCILGLFSSGFKAVVVGGLELF